VPRQPFEYRVIDRAIRMSLKDFDLLARERLLQSNVCVSINFYVTGILGATLVALVFILSVLIFHSGICHPSSARRENQHKQPENENRAGRSPDALLVVGGAVSASREAEVWQPGLPATGHQPAPNASCVAET
jgi:hypothetical protein